MVREKVVIAAIGGDLSARDEVAVKDLTLEFVSKDVELTVPESWESTSNSYLDHQGVN